MLAGDRKLVLAHGHVSYLWVVPEMEGVCAALGVKAVDLELGQVSCVYPFLANLLFRSRHVLEAVLIGLLAPSW